MSLILASPNYGPWATSVPGIGRGGKGDPSDAKTVGVGELVGPPVPPSALENL